MEIIKENSLIYNLSIIQDPRMDRCKKHLLIDIMVITVVAVISKCDTWADITLFANERKDWFKRFLKLPNGIPSHDTFKRVISLINPEDLQLAFCTWIKKNSFIKS